ncbi:tripartite tricarboxylate transporter substrate binding protein [Bradyrhizobium sp. AUGA SZCCT0240]|uniref:Bug family tripartite tricarboxylate transporter substrate binding protein n=1 Tax=unclassified Bradyrhizobium TaxID=2631580 RepID=UPI001BAC7892|nr:MULTISPECIES: tripartite tricarboxylate transporter substrate binding protein [unclassified Bradyrhizobium]MBR1194999.1 tripartite tricarboxylate transporter substrate binding protein [Bradyrhizobium sp. AUGA SZCCT0158]MBR1242775.1 tripartite tricarboxylate transporter substrate binding protein [Bradyrhizobium sp. AUGA SZCCT0274]MBR1252909.1 tripartite tricarboxylate transporter substrate binding protein [Bradyrhizobium sp. AUGA SZCCT0240]
MRGNALAVIIAVGFAASLNSAQAQNYPTRAIALVIPFAPGGSTSIVGRGIADKMSELLGEKVVVDNRPGAGGTIGTKAVAKSDPDGYTLVLGYTGTLAIGPSLYKSAGYDPRKDFAPIGLIGNAPNSLVVHPSFPAKTVAELIAHAKANPGKVNFGSAGAGTVSHITGEYFARTAGITLVHIPYKGTGPALTDLLGGHIPMAFAPIPASHSNVSAGKLRALAVTSTTRSGLLPDVPTMAEAGLAGFDASLYYGLAAPAGTPRPIIDKLNKVLRDALGSDEVKRQLANDGTEITPGTPEDYADFIDKDEKKWSQLIKTSGVEQE